MEYIGWVGTFFGMMSFLLLAIGKIKKEGLFFLISTAIASFSFFISSYYISNYQAAISNIFFFSFSIIALFGITLKINKIKESSLYLSCSISFFISTFYYLHFNLDNWFYQSIGWIPVISLPMLFLLFTQNKINEFKYFLLNMITNAIFFVHLIYFENYPLASLQVVAFIFALLGLKKTTHNI